MLFGEHAVLQGKHAISAAIDKRLHVSCTKRSDDLVIIKSKLGYISKKLSELIVEPPFTFVIQAILDQKMGHGLELEITSEMSNLFGLGTSAAVSCATTCALMLLMKDSFDPHDLFSKALKTIQKVQGRGSGADLAASVFGGCVLYRMAPCFIEKINCDFDLTAVYSGSKVPTPIVVAKIVEKQAKRKALFDSFFSAIDSIVLEAKQAIGSKDLQKLGELCTLHQGIMDAMGLSTKELSEIVYLLRSEPGIVGSKISGSGLGDCVIGFGRSNPTTAYPVLSLQISEDGLRVE